MLIRSLGGGLCVGPQLPLLPHVSYPGGWDIIRHHLHDTEYDSVVPNLDRRQNVVSVFIFVIIPLAALYMFALKFYVPTSRQLKVMGRSAVPESEAINFSASKAQTALQSTHTSARLSKECRQYGHLARQRNSPRTWDDESIVCSGSDTLVWSPTDGWAFASNSSGTALCSLLHYLPLWLASGVSRPGWLVSRSVTRSTLLKC